MNIEKRNIDLEANFTTFSEQRLSGNYTLNIELDVYQVSVNYGTGVQLYWYALKKGNIELERYQTYYYHNLTYYEEIKRVIEAECFNYTYPDRELINAWNYTKTVFDEVNTTYFVEEEEYPYAEYIHETKEFSTPFILTVQMYTTENRDKIAWANIINDFLIYQEEDQNAIYSCGNSPGTPELSRSTEYLGSLTPIAFDTNLYFDQPAYNFTVDWNLLNPTDMTVDDIVSTITFTPPTAINDTEISWGVDYPNFPLDIESTGLNDLDYWTPMNATYTESTPTSFSYDFEYSLGETQADLDMTWEIGKITNQTLYDKLQGRGLVMPQYNYFLGTFDLKEVDQAKLTIPQETFTFESNGEVVAEINMEKMGKENYTLYDFHGADAEFISRGGSVHPNVINFNTQGVYWEYSHELNNLLYSLGDFVAQDTEFIIADDLFRIETQNYPVWSGERLVHDPSLSIFYATPTAAGGIPGYNMILFLGVVVVVSVIMVRKLKKPKMNMK